MDIENIIAAANRAQQAEEAGLGNCSRIWHVGFFFDGIHRNIDQDAPEQRLSNVARLFRAFPEQKQDTPQNTHNKFYLSGLGTPFNEELAEKIHTIMDGAQNSVLNDLKDQPKEMAKDASIELIKGGNWWEILKGSGKKLITPAEWKKLTKDTAKSAAKRTFIEATPWLRDNPTIADMLVTGVDTRINSAKVRFKRFFERAKSNSPVPVKLISISLFGFDLGATLARKFADALLDDLCQRQGEKYTYKGIPVDIIFAGLFDCSRHTPASSKNGLGEFITWFGGPLRPVGVLLGDKSIDQDSPLNPAINKALHLVAAHENRLWRTLYRLGDESANYREEVLPGCSEDIGGGLKLDEQKPSAELCRVALHRMYREATMAGVPFPDFQTLDKTDIDVAAYCIMQNNVKNQSAAQWVKNYQRAIPAKDVSASALNHHMDSYITWLGIQYYQYLTEYQAHDDIRREGLASADSSAGLLGITPQARVDEKSHLNKMTILKTNWGWLEDIRSAALKLTQRIEIDPNDKRLYILPEIYGPGYRRAKKFLNYAHAASLGKPMPLPDDYAPGEIFSYFVHNVQAIDLSASISEEFFLIRLFDEIEV